MRPSQSYGDKQREAQLRKKQEELAEEIKLRKWYLLPIPRSEHRKLCSEAGSQTNGEKRQEN